MAGGKYFKTIFSIVALAVAATIIYHYFFYIPRRDKAVKAALEEKIFIEKELQAQTDSCIKEADAAYSVARDNKCGQLGRKSGCRLPSAEQANMEKLHVQLRGNCAQRYAP